MRIAPFLCLFLHFSLFAECPSSVTLTLNSALEMAINQNRALMNALDSTFNAQFQVEVVASDFDLQIKPRGDVGYIGGGTLGSGPTVGTGIEIIKKFPYGTKLSINPFIAKANHKYRTHINSIITQPLLRGFGKELTYSGLRAAEFAKKAACRAFLIAQTGVVVRTITALYEVVKAKKSETINQQSHARIEKFLQAAIVKSKIGLSDTLDVYRAETELRAAEDALKNSQERLQDAEDGLRDLLALSPEVELFIDIPVTYCPVDIDADQAIEVALAQRIEIDQAEDQLCENERLSFVSKDRLLPELNLVVNYSNFAEEQVFTEAWRRRQNAWGVGLTTSGDFNPKAERAAYEQSLIAIDAAQRGIEQVTSTVSFEVKRSMRRIGRAREKIELQKKQIVTSKGELRLAQLKFDRGMANNFDLIQAEKNLRSAELAYWHAIIDHVIGEYQLRGTLGILMEKPCL